MLEIDTKRFSDILFELIDLIIAREEAKINDKELDKVISNSERELKEVEKEAKPFCAHFYTF